jgi:hypothetical protein
MFIFIYCLLSYVKIIYKNFIKDYINAYSSNLKKSESNLHTHSKTKCDILMNGWLSILEGIFQI